MDYGYIRLSSIHTDPQEQIAAIGLPNELLYIDEYPRPELYFPQREKLLRKVQEGDTIHVKSIDRFFMNVADLKILLSAILEKKVVLHSHSENLIIGGENLSDLAKTFIEFSLCMDSWQKSVQREYEEELQYKNQFMEEPQTEDTQEDDQTEGSTPDAGKDEFPNFN